MKIRMPMPTTASPAPQGAGGLKFVRDEDLLNGFGPAPQGAGGLKLLEEFGALQPAGSRPARGGWIEIALVCGTAPA